MGITDWTKVTKEGSNVYYKMRLHYKVTRTAEGANVSFDVEIHYPQYWSKNGCWIFYRGDSRRVNLNKTSRVYTWFASTQGSTRTADSFWKTVSLTLDPPQSYVPISIGFANILWEETAARVTHKFILPTDVGYTNNKDLTDFVGRPKQTAIDFSWKAPIWGVNNRTTAITLVLTTAGVEKVRKTTSGGAVSMSIQELDPETVYSVQTIVTSEKGASFTTDRGTVTTQARPAAPTDALPSIVTNSITLPAGYRVYVNGSFYGTVPPSGMISVIQHYGTTISVQISKIEWGVESKLTVTKNIVVGALADIPNTTLSDASELTWTTAYNIGANSALKGAQGTLRVTASYSNGQGGTTTLEESSYYSPSTPHSFPHLGPWLFDKLGAPKTLTGTVNLTFKRKIGNLVKNETFSIPYSYQIPSVKIVNPDGSAQLKIRAGQSDPIIFNNFNIVGTNEDFDKVTYHWSNGDLIGSADRGSVAVNSVNIQTRGKGIPLTVIEKRYLKGLTKEHLVGIRTVALKSGETTFWRYMERRINITPTLVDSTVVDIHQIDDAVSYVPRFTWSEADGSKVYKVTGLKVYLDGTLVSTTTGLDIRLSGGDQTISVRRTPFTIGSNSHFTGGTGSIGDQTLSGWSGVDITGSTSFLWKEVWLYNELLEVKGSNPITYVDGPTMQVEANLGTLTAISLPTAPTIIGWRKIGG